MVSILYSVLIAGERNGPFLPDVLIIRTLDNSIRKQVKAHGKVTSNKRWTSGSGDILDLALSDTEYGTQATTSEIIDQMKSFFFAGNDSSSATLSWVYVYLSRNPETLVSLRKELDDV